MEVITIDSTAYLQLISKIEGIEKKVEDVAKQASLPLGEKWLDNQDVCLELNISKRTLQYYREGNLIPYSAIRHKIFYRASDIQKFLMSGYHKVKGF